MDYRVDHRVLLSTEREHKNLYSWSIKEFDGRGKQIGQDQVPWGWSQRFEVIELIPSCNLRMEKSNSADTETATRAEVSEHLYGKLRPSIEKRQSGLYSMFGAQRQITDFGLFIYKAKDGDGDSCRLWGTIGYSSEWDFEQIVQEDSVQIYVQLAAEKFEHVMSFVKFPRPTSAELRLTGVSGFYSEWSPSIRTDSIKVLANAKDQGLEDPEGLGYSPPALGEVHEFELQFRQQYPLILKERA